LSICCFELFRHLSVDPLLILLDAALTALRLAHGLHEPLAAMSGVRLATLRFAVLQDMFTLATITIISMCFKILFVDAHLPRGPRRRGLGGQTPANGDVLKLHAVAFHPHLGVTGYGAYS